MTQEEIKVRVREVLAKVLKVDPTAVGDASSQVHLPEWDSVRHMNVILALENDFGIEFEDAELAKLTSVGDIVVSVEKHLSE